MSVRLLDFAAGSIKLAARLNRTNVGRYITDQLARACASAGANYEEACGSESRADFIHKVHLVLKELRESIYWLRLAMRSELISSQDVQSLLEEADELARIMAQSLITAKGSTP